MSGCVDIIRYCETNTRASLPHDDMMSSPEYFKKVIDFSGRDDGNNHRNSESDATGHWEIREGESGEAAWHSRD